MKTFRTTVQSTLRYVHMYIHSGMISHAFMHILCTYVVHKYYVHVYKETWNLAYLFSVLLHKCKDNAYRKGIISGQNNNAEDFFLLICYGQKQQRISNGCSTCVHGPKQL